ncbi:4-oxalomesaconate tautomerase [Gordonia sp. CPCC 206044]|uniref:4-oxalomesaconate tautomerase n=1 Tax=Gordonia sp. CPCC 206044 TaxID=3140793 RepID=UPI003AF3929C
MIAVRCMLMRGGTSKGAYFLASDLPADAAERNSLLLRVMGSPDPRQIDGIGGGHPLTSKVAVVGPSSRPDADVDYLFLQVAVDQHVVSDSQNCGNILAGVGPFAVERGLVESIDGQNEIRIHMVNSGGLATARFAMDGGTVTYEGDTEIAGVPGTAAPIAIEFADTAGSTCGALFPSGRVVDEVDGVAVSCIDNGMPVVLVAAADLGLSGTESPTELEADAELGERVSSIRRSAGKLMGFDDVSPLTVPKVTLVSTPASGGTLNTRTFIPVRCHTSIGVLGALTVAAAARISGTVAHRVSTSAGGPVRIEHPTGFFDCDIAIGTKPDGTTIIERSAVLRTARKLFDGITFAAPSR